MGSTRWARNRRLKCECGGYWFPHRRGGGACDHSRTRDLHLARRSGDLDAYIDATFTTTTRPSKECPF